MPGQIELPKMGRAGSTDLPIYADWPGVIFDKEDGDGEDTYIEERPKLKPRSPC